MQAVSRAVAVAWRADGVDVGERKGEMSMMGSEEAEEGGVDIVSDRVRRVLKLCEAMREILSYVRLATG